VCTLIICWRHWREPWLLVAANRDEKLSRPATPPELWGGRRPALVAPRDLLAGGSWWGVNSAGLFAALTNRFGVTPPQVGLKSRGILLLEALVYGSADASAAFIYSLAPSAVNRFHLVLADRRQAFLFVHDGQKISGRRLRPGIHVVTERSFGAARNEREKFIREKALRWSRPPRRDTLRRLLSHHDDDPFAGTCVHAPLYAYGTRSSSIIRLGRRPRLLHVEGPPCCRPYRDYSRLLEALSDRE